MPDTNFLTLAGLVAVVAIAWLIAGRRRRRARMSEAGGLPESLYLAGHTANGSEAAGASRPVAGAMTGSTEPLRAWPRLGAGSGTARGASATAWAPAADETVQLLPGRLEPIAGVKQVIRFIRHGSNNRFTLGRGRGAARGHIQLAAPSVSRLHAYMEFEDGVWSVGSMSKTNPVHVNGTPLDPEFAHRLVDGDRIELGEAAFIFRHPVVQSEVPDGT